MAASVNVFQMKEPAHTQKGKSAEKNPRSCLPHAVQAGKYLKKITYMLSNTDVEGSTDRSGLRPTFMRLVDNEFTTEQ